MYFNDQVLFQLVAHNKRVDFFPVEMLMHELV